MGPAPAGTTAPRRNRRATDTHLRPSSRTHSYLRTTLLEVVHVDGQLLVANSVLTVITGTSTKGMSTKGTLIVTTAYSKLAMRLLEVRIAVGRLPATTPRSARDGATGGAGCHRAVSITSIM